MRISWNVISGFWTLLNNFKHIFLKGRSLVDCPLHRQKWFVHVVIQSLSNLVGDFLWIRTLGFITIFHHHVGNICIYFFQPPQANPRISSLFWIRPSLKLTHSHPEETLLEDKFPLRKAIFKGRNVSFREGILFSPSPAKSNSLESQVWVGSWDIAQHPPTNMTWKLRIGDSQNQ